MLDQKHDCTVAESGFEQATKTPERNVPVVAQNAGQQGRLDH